MVTAHLTPPGGVYCLQHEAKWDKAALTLFQEATQATSTSGSTGATTTQRQPDQDEPVSSVQVECG
jgi:hypothetical protein